MFVGAVPLEFVGQILDAVPFGRWRGVYVCCSGSFRPEVALRQRYPELKIVGCDVSLLSVVIGELAAGRPIQYRFKERLASLEDKLVGADAIDRAAAVLVAHEMATYRGNNPFSRNLFNHYLVGFEGFLAQARSKVIDVLHGLGQYEFFAGDFRVHAAKAASEGAGVLGFAPTYKAGYERLYKFLHENVEWPSPDYDLWDPKDLEGWLADLGEMGVDYCVLADRKLDGFEPKLSYQNNSGFRKIYGYANEGGSSVRAKHNASEPFVYTPVVPSQLSLESKISLVPVKTVHMTFLKDKYLKKGIRHTAARFNFLVVADGMLVGGFSYDYAHSISAQRTSSDSALYLLSDFSISRERRLAKLVAMLATCHLPVRRVVKETMTEFDSVETTVFTENPVSMKYRGLFELAARKPGKLRYKSGIRNGSPDEIYREWFRRWGREQAGNQGQNRPDLAP